MYWTHLIYKIDFNLEPETVSLTICAGQTGNLYCNSGTIIITQDFYGNNQNGVTSCSFRYFKIFQLI